MNKWLERVFGICVLAVLGLFFYDGWFHPEVPPVLRGLEDKSAPPAVKPSTEDGGTLAQDAALSEDEDELITLTSLQDMESDNGAPPPVLTTTQGEAPAAPENPLLAPTPPPPPQTAQEPPLLRLESLDNAAVAANGEETPAAVEPQPMPQETVSDAPSWIQAGAFGEKENAERLAASLRAAGLPVNVETATVGNVVYNRVYVGPLPEHRINATLTTLSGMGINARQVTR